VTQLCLLTDYQNRFGSKWLASPYRSGYDRRLLAKSFARYGYAVEYKQFSEVFSRWKEWAGEVVLYTSSEEVGNTYKTYVEDIVYGLEEAGAHLLPRAAFLRAHHNKAFMEILRDRLLGEGLTGLQSRSFGTLEELAAALERNEIEVPCVLKPASGAMSSGVTMARTAEEILRQAKQLSRTSHPWHEFKEYVRSRKLPGYRPESRYQAKFIVQPLIPGLDGDWKVLVYGDQYYVLKRHVRPGDFRASGSHVNYLPGGRSGIPDVVLSLVEQVYNKLDVPHLSVDVAFDGSRAYLFEFQAIYFGTSTHNLCEKYFIKQEGQWVLQKKTLDQEGVYAWGVAHYLARRGQPISAPCDDLSRSKL